MKLFIKVFCFFFFLHKTKTLLKTENKMIGELQYNLVTLLTDESTHSMKITTIVDMELYSSAFWLNLIQL